MDAWSYAMGAAAQAADGPYVPLPSPAALRGWLNISVRELEDYNALAGRGNKAADQAAWLAFEADAAQGYATALKLKSGRTYHLTRGLVFRRPVSIVGEGVRPIIIQHTGAGEFDWTGLDGAVKYGRSHVGILFDNHSGSVLEHVSFQMEANPAQRCCIPAAFRGCPEARASGLSFYRYNSPVNGMLCWQSSPSGSVENIYAEDCTTAFADPAFRPQVTVCEVDNDTPYPMYSTGSRFRNIRGKNIAVMGAGLAMWGAQSDILNIQSTTWGDMSVDDVSGFGVGEILDNFSSGLLARNIYGADVYYYPVKLIHGASRCSVDGVRVVRTGLSAALISLASGETGGQARNRITGVSASDIGMHHSAYAPQVPLVFGAYFDANSGVPGSHELSQSLIQGDFHGYMGQSGPAMAHAVAQISFNGRKAWGNRFVGNGSTYYHPPDNSFPSGATQLAWSASDGDPMTVFQQ